MLLFCLFCCTKGDAQSCDRYICSVGSAEALSQVCFPERRVGTLLYRCWFLTGQPSAPAVRLGSQRSWVWFCSPMHCRELLNKILRKEKSCHLIIICHSIISAYFSKKSVPVVFDSACGALLALGAVWVCSCWSVTWHL